MSILQIDLYFPRILSSKLPNYSLVFDIGQFSTKVGYAGENQPRFVFYSVTGTPKYKSIEFGGSKQIYVGNEVLKSIGLYKLSYPLENGDVVDWESFEALLSYAFYQLRVDSSIVNILFCINPSMPVETRKKICQIFLEKYQVMAYYPIRAELLPMYSGGFNTGVVVDIGMSCTRITPIFEGFIIKHAVQFLPLGGNTLDTYMRKRLAKLGIGVESASQREVLRILKERACFVSLNLQNDLADLSLLEDEYTLPDGSTIKIGEDRVMIPELFFQPQLNGIECDPLHVAIIKVVDACEVDLRRALLEKIFLSGGSSMFPQFETRLEQEILDELNRIGKLDQSVRILASRERMFANWIGGSILAMIPDFQKNWLTRSAYYKDGIPPEFLDL
jgi:actin-related protein